MTFVSGPGFSNGWALLALKEAPSVTGDQLIGSQEADQPSRGPLPAPASVVTMCRRSGLDHAEPASSSANPKASGSRTRVTARVRSTQKLPPG